MYVFSKEALIGFGLLWLCCPARADRILDAFVVRQWTQDNGLPSDQIEDLEAGPSVSRNFATARDFYIPSNPYPEGGLC